MNENKNSADNTTAFLLNSVKLFLINVLVGFIYIYGIFG